MRSVIIIPKKWNLALSEIESAIPILESTEDYKNLVDQFELIPIEIRDEFFASSYLKMWRVAISAGKISLANQYAKKTVQYLVEYKRIPQLKKTVQELLSSGIFKNYINEWKLSEDILAGRKDKIKNPDFNQFYLLLNHPEHWRQYPEFIRQYLLLENEWSQDLWKLCYEYILTKHFDKDLFLVLHEKSIESNQRNISKKFKELFEKKKIKVPLLKAREEAKLIVSKDKLNLDYDQIAMDLLSGTKEPSLEDQIRVINSLKFIPEQEFKEKGHEMIVAFELLGMELVVIKLCEDLVKVVLDVKQRASAYFVWAQALFNTEDFFKCIDLVDEVLANEPLYGDETLAFLYLKAEACLKLKKIKMAKELYLIIKKQNPHYRLVSERLKGIEKA